VKEAKKAKLTREKKPRKHNFAEDEGASQSHTHANKSRHDKSDSMTMVGDGLTSTPQQTDDSHASTKIALPISDTPVMRKNKDMRQAGGGGRRRSSLGMRGRRASSLMDDGYLGEFTESSVDVEDLLMWAIAVPHATVEHEEFYKHIAGELPEPRRMKQLLTWCGSRALGEKDSNTSTEEGNARAIARVINEELLKEFSNRSDMSNWFNREDTTPMTLVKKPNPRNLENLEKIRNCEKTIKR
jgi:kinetochore protein Mis13/DSN1